MHVVIITDTTGTPWIYGPFYGESDARDWIVEACSHLDLNMIQIKAVIPPN